MKIRYSDSNIAVPNQSQVKAIVKIDGRFYKIGIIFPDEKPCFVVKSVRTVSREVGENHGHSMLIFQAFEVVECFAEDFHPLDVDDCIGESHGTDY